MLFRNIVALLALLSLSELTAAQDSQLRLPSFRHLQDKAIDSVDITIGRWPLGIAAALVDDDSQDGVAAREILRGLKAIYVRSYKFKNDNSYSTRDIDEVRRQLAAPQWLPVAQMHSSQKDSDVDIFVSMDGDVPSGLAIVATQPREFTIVNIVGKVDPKNLSRIEKHFGLQQFGNVSARD